MEDRRNFLKLAMTAIGLVFNCPFSGIRWAWAQTKRVILPRETKRESLVHRNPAELDTRNLEVTPLKEFGTMGLTDHSVDLDAWKLEVAGSVGRPLSLSYPQIRGLPSIERNVLLICPGVFANHGTWKGISINELLRRAEAEDGVTHVTIRGPKGPYEKVQRYPIRHILSDKVFLAYAVNGKDLPPQHGFPLRVVAEDYYGYDWVKYVDSMTAEKI